MADRPDSKVARLIDRYGLDGLGDELERRWTADGAERLSLRDCAALFNRRLLEEALLSAGADAFQRDVEATPMSCNAASSSIYKRNDCQSTRNQLRRSG